jgi:nucleotide-binding universal stress UspA family protein
MPYQHVLVAYDGTAAADAAVRAGARLARDAGARLTVAAVVELATACRSCGGSRGCGITTAAWNRIMREDAWEQLLKVRKLLDVPAHLEVVCGPPRRALTDGARELGCDAIVLPARSGPFARLLGRGRPPRAVRRRAHCSVLQLR